MEAELGREVYNLLVLNKRPDITGKNFTVIWLVGWFGFNGSLIVVVVLLFYVNGKHLRSCRDGQLT